MTQAEIVRGGLMFVTRIRESGLSGFQFHTMSDVVAACNWRQRTPLQSIRPPLCFFFFFFGTVTVVLVNFPLVDFTPVGGKG